VKKYVATVEVGGFEVRYFRTHEESTEDDNKCLHGIYAAKYEAGNLSDEASTGPIAEDADQVNALILHMAENTVTPMVLFEILDEIHANFFEDMSA